MKTKEEVKRQLLDLFDLFREYGITNPTPGLLSRLQKITGSSFPSDGYIRLMLNDDYDNQPSEKFCRWLDDLESYIREGLSGDRTFLVAFAQSVGAVDSYTYTRKIHFVTMPDNAPITDFSLVTPTSAAGELVLALIPQRLRRVCFLDTCGRVFPDAPAVRYCCEAHRQEARRLRARERRKNAR